LWTSREQQAELAMMTPGFAVDWAASVFVFLAAEQQPTAVEEMLNHDDVKRMRRKTYLSVLYCRNFNSKRIATREDALPWVLLTREFDCFAGFGVRMTKERWKASEEHSSTSQRG
jgi:hypothetical protein